MMPRFPVGWALSNVVEIALTPTSRVFRAASPDFGEVVVKALNPDASEEKIGVQWQIWRSGNGAARVFDQVGDIVMMEYLPGPSLAQLSRSGGDFDAARILGVLAREIARPTPVQLPNLTPLSKHLGELMDGDPMLLPPDARAGFMDARSRAAALLNRSVAPIPLHGDLHHDNVLASARGWLAIDAKGLFGDPAFELANAFRNPDGDIERARDPHRATALAQLFMDSTGTPPEISLDWAIALCGASMIWNVGLPDKIAQDVSVQNGLLAARNALPSR